MLTIKKTDEGNYLVSLTNKTEELNRSNSYIIKKELSSIIRPNRIVTVDLKGATAINNGGLKIFSEVIHMAITKRCNLKFTNADPFVLKELTKIKNKKFEFQQEFELE